MATTTFCLPLDIRFWRAGNPCKACNRCCRPTPANSPRSHFGRRLRFPTDPSYLPKSDKPEILFLSPQGFLDQQLKGCLGGLELIPLALEIFEAPQNLMHRVIIA